MIFKVLNFLAFQICWPLTVISAAKGYPYTGVIATLIWASLHLFFLNKNKFEGAMLLLIALCIGTFCETSLLLLGTVSYPDAALTAGPAPLWIIALWVNVALTLNHCLSWINKNLLLAVVLGMIFGPLAYNGGIRLGAITFDPVTGSMVIGLMWAVAMPLLITINKLVHGQTITHRSLDVEY